PRLEGDLLAAAPQRAVGADHRGLEGVLGVLLVPQHRAAVAVERVAVAGEEGLEGPVVTAAHTARQPGVALSDPARKRRPPRAHRDHEGTATSRTPSVETFGSLRDHKPRDPSPG